MRAQNCVSVLVLNEIGKGASFFLLLLFCLAVALFVVWCASKGCITAVDDWKSEIWKSRMLRNFCPEEEGDRKRVAFCILNAT